MTENSGNKARRTRRDLIITLSVSAITLLLFFVLPGPWNNYALVLAIGFFVLAVGVFVQR